VLRIFGSNRKGVTEGWKNLLYELHNLYSTPIIISKIGSRRMRWAGHVTCRKGKSNAHKVLVGKFEGWYCWKT
jgi:hypothetical protein